MKRAKQYRAESRELLDHKLFGNAWLKALLFLLIISAIVGAVSSFTFGIVGVIISGPLSYGAVRALLKVVRKEEKEVNFNHLLSGFNEKLSESIVTALLSYIYVFLWSLLLVIPGIVKSYSYSAAMYLVHEKGLSGNEAITESRKLMKGKKWKAFCLDLSFIGWYIVGMLCLGVGVLWVSTYHEVAKTCFFDDVLKEGACAGECHCGHCEEKVEVVDAK